MSFMGILKKQFISVIDWTEEENGILAFRFPMEDREIQTGAQLTVRETQLALFVNEGEVADLFQAGLHTLNTQNLPVLTTLKNWDKLFKSPFKSDVYFFSTRDQIDQKWGTPNAITVRDKDFGAIRLRAHGTYSYCLKNPQTFFKKISGTRERFTTQELEGQIRSMILTNMASFFGSSQIAFLDMAANQNQFSETLKTVLIAPFNEYGLKLQSFYVQSVSLPEELQTHLDKLASMKMVGDLRSYAQFQAADAIALAAQHEGGTAGAMAGVGAGMALGQSFANALSGSFNQGVGSNAGANSGANVGANGPEEDPLATISKLHEMCTKGIITQIEFDAKKAELLKKIK